MTGQEGTPQVPNDAATDQFAELGGLDALQGKFGLGERELSQPVEYGKYKGTVAEMLADEKCPFSDDFAEAFEHGGIDEVAGKVAILNMLSKSEDVVISEDTYAQARAAKEAAENEATITSEVDAELEARAEVDAALEEQTPVTVLETVDSKKN